MSGYIVQVKGLIRYYAADNCDVCLTCLYTSICEGHLVLKFWQNIRSYAMCLSGYNVCGEGSLRPNNWKAQVRASKDVLFSIVSFDVYVCVFVLLLYGIQAHGQQLQSTTTLTKMQ